MSLQLRENVSLKPYNTFALEARARLFAEAHDDDEVREALVLAAERGLPLLVLGGGSNLLLTRDVEALVLRMASRGVRLLADDGERVLIEAEAGEPWHPFVQHALEQGLAGLENLSLIPGTVGAAPMQNIGAYGVEIKDVLASLVAIDRQSGELREFAREECAFGYRDSLFKRQAGRWLILRVRFALQRTPRLHLDYGPVRQWLAERGWNRRHPGMSAGRSVPSARRNSPIPPCWAMPAVSSRTRWFPPSKPSGCAASIPIWSPTRRPTMR